MPEFRRLASIKDMPLDEREFSPVPAEGGPDPADGKVQLSSPSSPSPSSPAAAAISAAAAHRLAAAAFFGGLVVPVVPGMLIAYGPAGSDSWLSFQALWAARLQFAMLVLMTLGGALMKIGRVWASTAHVVSMGAGNSLRHAAGHAAGHGAANFSALFEHIRITVETRPAGSLIFALGVALFGATFAAWWGTNIAAGIGAWMGNSLRLPGIRPWSESR